MGSDHNRQLFSFFPLVFCFVSVRFRFASGFWRSSYSFFSVSFFFFSFSFFLFLFFFFSFSFFSFFFLFLFSFFLFFFQLPLPPSSLPLAAAIRRLFSLCSFRRASMNVLIYTGEGAGQAPIRQAHNMATKLLGHRYDIKRVGHEVIINEPWKVLESSSPPLSVWQVDRLTGWQVDKLTWKWTRKLTWTITSCDLPICFCGPPVNLLSIWFWNLVIFIVDLLWIWELLLWILAWCWRTFAILSAVVGEHCAFDCARRKGFAIHQAAEWERYWD